MMIYVAAIMLLTSLYALLFLFYLVGWLTLPEFPVLTKTPFTKVSVIVPARNEAEHIGNLLSDLMSQSYDPDLFEIIVVDDESTDNTAAIVSGLTHSNSNLYQIAAPSGENPTRGHKKKALEHGISKANGELIVTTDADCRMGKEWLRTIVAFYELNKCKMIVAPVAFTGDRGFFEHFQSLDFLGLIGITGATLRFNFAVMCNGANLAFAKDAFEEVNGYTGNNNLSSGDDVLLMHKMARPWPRGVLFLKNRNAIVYTFPQRSWRAFLSQRLRWVSKSKYYSNIGITANLLLVYLFNLSILLTALFAVFNKEFVLVIIFQLIVKMIVEFAFLSQVARFFERGRLLSLFLPAQLFHIFYVVIAGALGNFLKPYWKGRRIT